jgi:thioredoxin 1
MIDIAYNKQIKTKYNITSYPTLFVYKEGQLLNRSTGYRTKSVLVSQLKGYYPNLNTSKVNLPAKAAANQPIPLAKLGEKSPPRPMLVADENLASAAKQYPFLAVMGFMGWCGYCDQMNQTILNLSRELQGEVAFAVIDIEKNNATKSQYNITSYPTTLIFRNGSMVKTVKGYQRKASFVATLKQIDPALDTSRVTVEKASPAKAPRPRLTPEQACVNMTKSDQPMLSAFVVSRCPFGLQMQRIMANITDMIPEAARYMEVRYIGSALENGTITSMHGEQEAQENLRQICIREEQSDKYWDYVRCYMKEGKSEECLKFASVDADKLGSCMEDTGRGSAYAREDFAQASKYGITGSPTMVMGGKVVYESDFSTNTTNSRSPEALKELLCCGFDKEPDFCEKQLDPSRAATMFYVKLPPKPKLTPEQACFNMTKSDQPMLSAFVVSRCPFGLQMQRIMANITDMIPEAARYMEVRYIGSALENGTITSMHGEQEAQENLRQICIREEQPDKYWNYVKCYMKEGKSEECLKSTSVDTGKLDSCMDDTGRGSAYAKEDFAQASKYGITGSPTLVMGGKEVSEFDFATNTTNGRSPEALKELLCCGFDKEPDFCEVRLNESRAATMYSKN